MRLTWDPAKRASTFAERGLDFADAAIVFAGVVWRLVWPWTGKQTDLIFIAIMVVGIIAARIALGPFKTWWTRPPGPSK